MKSMFKVILAALILPIAASAADKAPAPLKPAQVKKDMKRVADWQMAHFYDVYKNRTKPHHPLYWGAGAFYVGLVKYADMAGNDSYFEWLKDIGDKYSWQLDKRIYHADDHVVGQMYVELGRRSGDETMYGPTKDRLDYIMANPSTRDVVYHPEGQKYVNLQRWTWCDALFMSPPVWAKLTNLTGDDKYLDWMMGEYKATTDHLFDPEENLYYRDNRYLEKRDDGKKIFWSRGNGWVFGGLTLIMDELPQDSEEYAYFKDLYTKMAAKLITIQTEEGHWAMSLLGADKYPTPETSGTGFFCFGLAWGINNGVLDRETYEPHVLLAWKALTSHITKDGMLGYVQPIGASPGNAWPEHSQQYGSGAFLAAGSEVYKMLGGTIEQRDLTALFAPQLLKDSKKPAAGESYPVMTTDGAWCWFQDPRAIYYKGEQERIYASWMTHDGNLYVGSRDCKTGEIKTCLMKEKFDADDHNVGSFLVLPDKRIVFFYARHSRDKLFCRTSVKPESISSWGPEITITKGKTNRCTYSHPVYLSDEKKMYVFWRDTTWKPSFSTSTDGIHWTDIQMMLQEPGKEDRYVRPYTKVSSDGKSKIYITCTDGHPRNEEFNSLYYVCYENGEFKKADGTVVGSMDNLPLAISKMDKVYDAQSGNGRAWVWDISPDKKGRPVIAYTRHPSERDHRYHCARWNGESWIDDELMASGGWFPQTIAGEREHEPHYSGGLCIDHANTRRIYASGMVDGQFEIFRLSRKRSGEWETKAITENSTHRNVRPVVPRGWNGPGECVMWMNGPYEHYMRYNTNLRIHGGMK